MPLHDWRKGMDWFTVHQVWAGEIVGYLKPRLPPGYRAQLGPIPKTGGITVGVPDAHVREVREEPSGDGDVPQAGEAAGTWGEPDRELLLVDLETDSAVFIHREGRLVTAIELISPGNKDSPEERDETAARYANYLRGGSNLIVVDVHPQPDRPTLPDRLSERYKLGRAPLPAPYAIVYRVGRAGRPGRKLALWSFPLAAGQTLPTVPVPLSETAAVPLDLDETYAAAAAHAYLD